jgi:hypothetical protein
MILQILNGVILDFWGKWGRRTFAGTKGKEGAEQGRKGTSLRPGNPRNKHGEASKRQIEA